MDKNVETLKNGLALVGAITVVTAAPVLSAGVAIGVLATNPDKVKEAAEKIADKIKEINKKSQEASENFESDYSEEDDDFGLDEFFEDEDRRDLEEEAVVTAEEAAAAFDETE